jgi:hypothetical protein
MAISILSENEAWSEGAKLWVVGELASSKWARRVDWYLGFQILRATSHKTRDLSPELQETLKSLELSSPDTQVNEKTPLMVGSAQLLPNEITVQIPNAASPAEWIERCQKLWQNLNKPSMRVFLPRDFSEKEFAAAWKRRADLDHSLSVVVE